MVGLSVRTAYPSTVNGPVWQAYRRVLADAEPRQLGPMDFPHTVDGVARQASYSIRVHRAGGGLLVGWIRHDGPDGTGRERSERERIAQTERLASLGWGEWDLRTGQVTWSDELYRIYERDPALGPLPREESAAMVLPEDEHIGRQSAEAFARGETVDITYRIHAGNRVKHLRAVIDAVRDGNGQPLRLYGIVQDVTARELARVRLATVERQLREHQQTLAAEHRLAAQLQQIVLPIPAEPFDLPGLRVALRYLPAERASRVGGDWYHAATVPDGSVLLAVGDVAGHGLQAATTMAQLRHALAALAITTTAEPAELLSHLNRLLCASEASAGTATAVIARYDPSSGALRWAQAGHPPPLHTRHGATVSLDRPRGPLLGAVPDARYDTATVQLAEHDLLVFYTDGLVEDRQRSLEEGLAPVVATLNEISGRWPQAPLAELLERLQRANPDDDTCVLAARPQSAGAPRADVRHG
jgi:serine phosphatase RsbU (regulator of sigma subunit)